MENMLQDTSEDQAMAYTDGSCLGNPGPLGDGTIIYSEHNKLAIRLSRAVAQRGSILLAALVTVILVLEFVIHVKENLY